MEKMAYNTFKEAPPFGVEVMCSVKLVDGFRIHLRLTYYDDGSDVYDREVYTKDCIGENVLLGHVESWRFLTEKEKKRDY